MARWSVRFGREEEAGGSRSGYVRSMSSHWVRVVCSMGLRVMWVRGMVGRWGDGYIR